jgi:hypothetical protein
MTGHQPGADAGDELCPWLTETEAAFATPSPHVGASDELCPHLTEPDGAVPDTQPPVVRVPRAVGVAYAARGTVTPGPWVRPYVLTGGRTRVHQNLLVHTLVTVPEYNTSLVAQLPPEARSLYERAHAYTESVAELSAHCGLPLGVTRVLLSDLASAGHMLIGPDAYPSPYDSDLLERIIDGLQQFA